MNDTERSIAWFAGGSLATAAVAWVAFQIQQEGIAPAVLFPLLVGAVLGIALATIRTMTRRPSRRVAVVAAVCWGLLAVVAQDYIGHIARQRDYARQVAAQQHPLAAAMQAELAPSLVKHLRKTVTGQPVWWSLDVLLTAAAAGAVVGLGLRNNLKPSIELPADRVAPAD